MKRDKRLVSVRYYACGHCGAVITVPMDDLGKVVTKQKTFPVCGCADHDTRWTWLSDEEVEPDLAVSALVRAKGGSNVTQT